MTYLVIEYFKPGRVKEMYARFDEKGRMLPDGVQFVSSYINEAVSICWQIMEAESMAHLQQWISCWSDLVDFEVVPVISSAEARQKIFSS